MTYGTAKEVGFDFLRDQLATSSDELVQRPFHFALVDEADSIMVDEGRVPLVIAADRDRSEVGPTGMAGIVGALTAGQDWKVDEGHRNVHFTDRGLDRVEAALGGVDLHASEHYLELTEANQALHARALLTRGIDYIVRNGRIELVDDATGRAVPDRRWPDGLQAALEAKEGLMIAPGGQVLGSITMQHYLLQYPKISGMTGTARSCASEVHDVFGIKTLLLGPNIPCVRYDRSDVIFRRSSDRDAAVVRQIERVNRTGRPILVGTSSVAASERLSESLKARGVPHRILNARNDEAESQIVAEAGALHAVHYLNEHGRPWHRHQARRGNRVRACRCHSPWRTSCPGNESTRE